MMLAMTGASWLLTMWISFMLLVLAGIIVVFVWAVRAKQFANQDRARYLALKSGIPREPPPAGRQEQGGAAAGGEKEADSHVSS